jgi:hypothetical protein
LAENRTRRSQLPVKGYDFFNYQFDASGRVTSATSLATPASNYGYDSQGYDANGNRIGPGYVVGPGNQLRSDGVWNYSYDAEGNLAGKASIATGETWTFRYDNINHLTHVEQRSADGTLLMQADYKYDVFSNRIEKDVWTATQGMVVTRYGLDGFNNGKPTPVGNENWDVWAELDGNNNLQTRYIDGDAFDQAFARIDAGGTRWLLTDNLQSVRDVIDSAGNILDRIGSTGRRALASQGGDGDGHGQVVAKSAQQFGVNHGFLGGWAKVGR